MYTELDEDEIDIKEIFKTLGKHKKKIFFSVMLFALLAAIYAYITPNVYSTYTTIEMGETKTGGGSRDILAMAMNAGETNVDTEIEIIKSRRLIKKALREVDFTHRYYAKKNYKETELYTKSPFDVVVQKGKGVSFYVHPVNAKYYMLKAKGVDPKTSKEWEIEKKYQYGQSVDEKNFDLTLTLKDGEKLDKGTEYRFVAVEPDDAVEEIQKNLSVDLTSKRSSILKIKYNDTVPLRAQQFTDALAKAYLKQEIERKTQEASMVLAFIDKQLAEVNTSLKDSENKLENFKKKSSMISLGTKTESVVDKISEYESKLAKTDMESHMLDTLYTQVKNGKNIESITTAGLDLSETGIPKLIQKLQEAVLKRRVLREDYTPAHPEVKKLTQSIAQIKKIITSTIKTLKIRVNRRKELLKKNIKDYEALMEELPEKEKIFGGLKRKFIVNEKIYSYLLEKRATTAIAKSSTVNKSRILDKAHGAKKIKPKQYLIVLAGIISGLIIGIITAFILEFLDDRIKTEDDIRKISNLPLMGSIPHIEKGENAIKVFDSPKSVAAEAFRSLRTNLQFLRKEGGTDDPMVISVTSTVGGEGKTTVSTNLAGIIAMTGKKTIVLNMDMRKPMLHKKFSLPNKQGMSTLLSKKAKLKDVIQHTEYQNLDVISSGPIPPNPSELASSEAVSEIIKLLKKSYDVIIMDTPPLGLVADAMPLMHMSNATLYVLRSGYSKKIYLEDIERILKEFEVSGFGLLLNDIKVTKNGYGYGYGSGYFED